jgi:hypothetical protein
MSARATSGSREINNLDRVFKGVGFFAPYSYLSATIGSTCVARRAGM